MGMLAIPVIPQHIATIFIFTFFTLMLMLLILECRKLIKQKIKFRLNTRQTATYTDKIHI